MIVVLFTRGLGPEFLGEECAMMVYVESFWYAGRRSSLLYVR